METARLGMKKCKTLKGWVFFLKHILYHVILAPALSTIINLEMLKKVLVPSICHIEIMIYIRKFTAVNILGWTPC